MDGPHSPEVMLIAPDGSPISSPSSLLLSPQSSPHAERLDSVLQRVPSPHPSSNKARMKGEKVKVIDWFINAVKAAGITQLFGITGANISPLFCRIEDNKDLSWVISRFEGGASFMAAIYSLAAGGKPAMVAATAGPGAMNLINGVASAYSSSVPMLVVTGQPPAARASKGALQELPHEFSHVDVFKPITKMSTAVTSPARLCVVVQQALCTMLTGRKGPVHINVPVNLWLQPLPEPILPHDSLIDALDQGISPDHLLMAAEAITRSNKTLVLVGNGVRFAHAKHEVAQFVGRCHAKVISTVHAKGLFPEDHPAYTGILGLGGHQSAAKALDACDLLISVGSSLGEMSSDLRTDLTDKRVVIQIDVDSSRLRRLYVPHISILADAKTAIEYLLANLPLEMPQSLWPDVGDLSVQYENIDLFNSDTSKPMEPARMRKDLMEVLPDNAVICTDIGGTTFFNLHLLKMTKDQQHLLNLSWGSMGHMTAGVVGAAVALPDCPVIAIVGDGSFQMHGMEMITALEYKINNVIWIIDNNACEGMVYHGLEYCFDKKYKHTLQNTGYQVSYAKMAEACGIMSFLVDSPNQIQDALKKALEHDGPTVIEVRTINRPCPTLIQRCEQVFKKK